MSVGSWLHRTAAFDSLRIFKFCELFMISSVVYIGLFAFAIHFEYKPKSFLPFGCVQYFKVKTMSKQCIERLGSKRSPGHCSRCMCASDKGWEAGVSVAISGTDTHVRRTQVICPYPNPPRGFGVFQVRGTFKKKKPYSL